MYSSAQLDYGAIRTQEFLDSTARLLKRRLEPGWAKAGKSIPLGQCPAPWFHHWFHHGCGGVRKQRVYTCTQAGLRMPYRRFYYSWPKGKLPSLNQPVEDWCRNNHGDGNGHFSANVESYYTSIGFTFDEFTGRVWLKYEQTTAVKIGDQNVATA
jgi:hypothetical protein